MSVAASGSHPASTRRVCLGIEPTQMKAETRNGKTEIMARWCHYITQRHLCLHFLESQSRASLIWVLTTYILKITKIKDFVKGD